MTVTEGIATRRWLALLAALCLLAAACSSSDDSSDDTGEGTTPETEETAEADPDGVIRTGYDLVAAAKGGVTLDPTQVTTQLTDSGLFEAVYGLLFRPTADGELVPELAESGEVVDANTIEVTLREGLTFSDGTPLDAEAAVAGIERNLAATDSVGFGTAFFDAASVEVVDPLTFRVDIPNGTAAAWYDSFLGSYETTIVKPGETNFQQPVGAGPMMVTEWVPESRMTLTRNDAYWDPESITVGGLELLNVSDAQAAASALRADQVDMASVDVNQIDALGSDFEIYIDANPNQMATFMMCKRDGEPLGDPNVRLAVNKAIDREVVNEVVYGGTYEPSSGIWPDGHRFHDSSLNDVLAYDPEAARELLAESDYADGVEFDLYVIPTAGLPEAAEVIKQQLAEVGITMNIILAQNYVNDFLVAQQSGAGMVPTASPNRLKLLQWSGESVGNTCTYSDPDLEALQDQLNAVSDSSDEAVELWHQIEELVVNDALSGFLWFGSTLTGYDPNTLGDVGIYPTVIMFPDIRTTFVKA